jgi:catechol 2,3-dioxygenase-like lactoylglutathione lyase family enzyme
MKSRLCLIAFLALSLPLYSQARPEQDSSGRPRIRGIDHVSFYTTQPDGVKALYGGFLGLASAAPIESGESTRYLVGKRQWVGFSTETDPTSTNRMDHVAFATDNAVALRQYLLSKNVKVQEIEKLKDGSASFSVTDPDGHHVEFVQRTKSEAPPASESAVSRHMIHAGFLVRDRDAEDRFYRDLLGFHLYWHGGMQPGRTDWVSMQVPDGTDWLEYMLNQPEHPDLRTLGVLDHISLGVADMKKSQAMLEANGWKAHGNEVAKMGKDGKWQLNLFDPDQSRIELMEFQPSEKPCCSEFTGTHPSD